MQNRTRSIILAIAILQIVIIVGLMALPTVVQAIPGRYRVWLQENHQTLSGFTEGVIDQVAPVATALPAPQQAAGEQVDISSIIAAAPASTVAASELDTELIAVPQSATTAAASPAPARR